MKKILIFYAIALMIISCSKSEDTLPISQPANNIGSSKKVVLSGNVVYSNNACTLADGSSGCKCEITETDDDCSLQTDCKSSSALPHYKAQLHALFTDEQITERALNEIRITETELIDALKLDGYPLK